MREIKGRCELANWQELSQKQVAHIQDDTRISARHDGNFKDAPDQNENSKVKDEFVPISGLRNQPDPAIIAKNKMYAQTAAKFVSHSKNKTKSDDVIENQNTPKTSGP